MSLPPLSIEVLEVPVRPSPRSSWEELLGAVLELEDEDIASIFYTVLPLLRISVRDVLEQLLRCETPGNQRRLGPALLPLMQRHSYLTADSEELQKLLRQCAELVAQGGNNLLLALLDKKVPDSQQLALRRTALRKYTESQVLSSFSAVVQGTEPVSRSHAASGESLPWCINSEELLGASSQLMVDQDFADEGFKLAQLPKRQQSSYRGDALRLAQLWLDHGLLVNLEGEPSTFKGGLDVFVQLSQRGKSLLMGSEVTAPPKEMLATVVAMLKRLRAVPRTVDARAFEYTLARSAAKRVLREECKNDMEVEVQWDSYVRTYGLFAPCNPWALESDLYYITPYGIRLSIVDEGGSSISGPTDVTTNQEAVMEMMRLAAELEHGGHGSARRHSPKSTSSTPKLERKKSKKKGKFATMTRSASRLVRRKSQHVDPNTVDHLTLPVTSSPSQSRRRTTSADPEEHESRSSSRSSSRTGTPRSPRTPRSEDEGPLVGARVSFGKRPPQAWTSLDQCDVTALAEQLAVRFWNVYSRILPSDFVGQPWRGDQPAGQCLRDMAVLSNSVTQWLATEILTCIYPGSSPKKMLAKVLVLGVQLMEINCFQGAMAVAHAVQKHPVDRLEHSLFEELKGSDKQRLGVLKDLASPYNSFKNYREALAACDSGVDFAVPYSGVTQQDVTFIEEGNPTRTEGGHYNWEKFELLDKSVMTFVGYKVKTAPYAEEAAFFEWFTTKRLELSDEVLDAQSQKYQPSKVVPQQ